MTSRFAFLSLLAVLSLGRPSLGGGQEHDFDPRLTVREHTLDNGLRLFILPRPGAPIVSFVVQYRIGGVNEAPGNTGIAHLLEHLLFKGTTSVGTRDFSAEEPLLRKMDVLFDSLRAIEDQSSRETALSFSLRAQIRELEGEASSYVSSNEYDQILSANGARSLNAITTSESTTYFVELPSNRTELWFVLEGDRMLDPVFREFFSERDVVAEERRLRMDNDPQGLLYEAHLGAAFQTHPYGTPVVGSMEDIQRLSRTDVREYFRRFYGPNNAVVVIAGNVDPSQVLRWAQKYLGPVPPGEAPPLVRTVEPPQRGERRVDVVYDAEPSVRIGWKVPSAQDEDAPALYMLMSVLTGGRSSRIYRRLVLEDRIASGVTSTIEPGQLYPGLFTIHATPLHPHPTQELEEAIFQELEKLRMTPPEEGELQRIRNHLEASEVRRLRSNFGLALQVAASATFHGDWETGFEFSSKLLRVTPQDIQRVVTKYFLNETRTVATLIKAGESGAGG